MPLAAGDATSVIARYGATLTAGYPGGSVASKRPGDAARTIPAACSIETPGLRRPITVSHHMLPESSRAFAPCQAGSAQIGIATSNVRPTSRPKNDGGVTPMTVARNLPIGTGLPTIAGSPPNSRCQNPWLITTPASMPQPRRSSASVNNRPRIG